MNTQMFNYRIQYLSRAIHEELLQLIPDCTLPTLGTFQYDELWQKLAHWKLQIDLLTRDIAGARHMVDLDANRLPFIPRNKRYAARQSVTHRVQALRGVEEAVTDLRNDLDKLLQRAANPTPQELIKLTAELYENLHDRLEEQHDALAELSCLVAQPRDPVIRQSQVDTAPQDVLVTLTVIGRLLQLLAMRIAKGSNRK